MRLKTVIRECLEIGQQVGASYPQQSTSTERRAYSRTRLDVTASLIRDGWKLKVRGIDQHCAGALVHADRPIAVGSVIFFHDTCHQHVGWATVRRCSGRWWRGYSIGLEFKSPLMRVGIGAWHFYRLPFKEGDASLSHVMSNTGQTSLN